MTVLQRTDLTTSQKIQCAAAAVAGQHAHGSEWTYEISRPTVYAVGAAAESVLRAHFEAPLLQGAAVDVRVDDAQLRRAVVALRVLANAIRPIEDLVPLLYRRCRTGRFSRCWSRPRDEQRGSTRRSRSAGSRPGRSTRCSARASRCWPGWTSTRGICSGCRFTARCSGAGAVGGWKDAARGIAAGAHAEQRDAQRMCSTR